MKGESCADDHDRVRSVLAREAPEKLKALEAGALTIQGAKRQMARERAPLREDRPELQDTEPTRLAAEAIKLLANIKDDSQLMELMERVRTYAGNRARYAAAKASVDGVTAEEQLFLFKG